MAMARMSDIIIYEKLKAFLFLDIIYKYGCKTHANLQSSKLISSRFSDRSRSKKTFYFYRDITHFPDSLLLSEEIWRELISD
jgi:hypothetical protein